VVVVFKIGQLVVVVTLCVVKHQIVVVSLTTGEWPNIFDILCFLDVD
jgi:hypothetical protein